MSKEESVGARVAGGLAITAGAIIGIICLFVLGVAVFNHVNMSRNSKELSDKFLPAFNDVNSGLDGKFSYKGSGLVVSANGAKYYLEYSGGEDEFAKDSIALFNRLCGGISGGRYDEKLFDESYNTIKIKSRSNSVTFYFDRFSLGAHPTVTTDVICDYLAFEELDGISKLNVDMTALTAEQKEYAKSFAEKCAFKIEFWNE